MKNLIILLLLSTSVYAQNSIRLGLYQDVKLATIGDNKGNEAFTHNTIVRSTWSGYQFENYFFSIIMEYEFSDLKGGQYHRYSAGGQYNFNKLFDRWIISPSFQTGVIARNGQIPFTAVGNIDVSYQLGNFEISSLQQLTWRTDLERKKLGIGWFLGITYNINLKDMRK